MKIKATRILSLAGVLVLLLLPLMATRLKLKADIPFDFNVGNTV